VPLAAAATPQEPDFPKKGLMMGVSIPLGAAAGVIAALLLELVSRRIRSAGDLQAVVRAPVLAVLQNPDAPKKRRFNIKLPRPRRLGVRTARA
jgi:capsular polysaccharide biosynthesis protein